MNMDIPNYLSRFLSIGFFGALLGSVLLGPVSAIAKVLFGLGLVSGIGLFLYKPKCLIENEWGRVLLLMFLANMIWVFLVPFYYHGFDGVRLAWSEADALLWLPLVSFAIALRIGRPSSFIKTKYVIGIGLGLALIFFWEYFHTESRMKAGITLAKHIFNGDLYIGPASPFEGDRFFRVFFINLLWIPVVLFFTRLVSNRLGFRLLSAAILVFLIVVSYSRGFWLAIVLAVIALYFVDRKESSKHAMIIISGLVVAIPLILISYNLSGNLSARASSIVSSAKDLNKNISISSRFDQTSPLIEEWLESPLLGFGYGHFVPEFIRSDISPYSYEMVPLALLMKLGAVGIVVNLFFLLWIIRKIVFLKQPKVRSSCFASIVFLLAASMTNPYLFNFVGMSIFSFTCWATASSEARC